MKSPKRSSLTFGYLILGRSCFGLGNGSKQTTYNFVVCLYLFFVLSPLAAFLFWTASAFDPLAKKKLSGIPVVRVRPAGVWLEAGRVTNVVNQITEITQLVDVTSHVNVLLFLSASTQEFVILRSRNLLSEAPETCSEDVVDLN